LCVRINHRLFAGFIGIVGLMAILTVGLLGSGLRRELTEMFRGERGSGDERRGGRGLLDGGSDHQARTRHRRGLGPRVAAVFGFPTLPGSVGTYVGKIPKMVW
jgi:hypothetical protein